MNDILYEAVKIPLSYNIADFCLSRFGAPMRVYGQPEKGDNDKASFARTIKAILKGKFHPIEPCYLTHLPVSGDYSTDWTIAVSKTQPVTEYHKRSIAQICERYYKEAVYIELLYIKKPSLAQKVDYFIEKYRLSHEYAHENIINMYKHRRARLAAATAHLTPIEKYV